MRGESVANALATNVRKIMQARNISGRKLAALSGRNAMTINNLLNGKHMPGADVLFDVCDALGVTVEEIRPPQKKSKKSA